MREPAINPPTYQDNSKLIEMKIQLICQSIAEKGFRSPYTDICDYLYECIEEDLKDGE